MTVERLTDAEYLEMCEAEIAQHEQCGGCDKATIARELRRRISASTGETARKRMAVDYLDADHTPIKEADIPEPAHPHLIDGEFQSDKYPTTPRGKVPLSCKDKTAQDLLWEYAQRRRTVDVSFSNDLETALKNAGYAPEPERVITEEIEITPEMVEAGLEEYVTDYFQLEKDTVTRIFLAMWGARFGSPIGEQLKPACPVPPGKDEPVSTETASE